LSENQGASKGKWDQPHIDRTVGERSKKKTKMGNDAGQGVAGCQGEGSKENVVHTLQKKTGYCGKKKKLRKLVKGDGFKADW